VLASAPVYESAADPTIGRPIRCCLRPA
jgi:hypothetical protein